MPLQIRSTLHQMQSFAFQVQDAACKRKESLLNKFDQNCNESMTIITEQQTELTLAKESLSNAIEDVKTESSDDIQILTNKSQMESSLKAMIPVIRTGLLSVKKIDWLIKYDTASIIRSIQAAGSIDRPDVPKAQLEETPAEAPAKEKSSEINFQRRDHWSYHQRQGLLLLLRLQK